MRFGSEKVGRWWRLAILWALPLLLLVGTACNKASGAEEVASLGDSKAAKAGGAKASADEDPQEAFLKFAECMRENGVQMDDPTFEGEKGEGPVKVELAGPEVNEEKFGKADKACRHLLKGAAGGQGPGKIDGEAQDAFLKFARCMREHGIDMPDPDPSHGALISRGEDGPGETPEKFREADKACKHHLAKALKDTPVEQAGRVK